jgi:SAM-dependent methyltransferase
MPVEFAPLHRYLSFNAPLSGRRAGELVKFLTQHAQGTVVDVGCGWAEFLLRLLDENEGIQGIGIDRVADGFEHARRQAVKRKTADRLELICGDVRQRLPASVQGAVCIGASQIWGPPVEARLPLDYSAALAALRRLAQPGMPVVYGEAIWSAAPTDAAAAPLAGRLDEFAFLPALVELAWSHGFAVVRVHEATLDEWDEFESGHVARYACWLAEHPPTHPDVPEVQAMARRQRDAYFRGYRGILGMAYLSLLAV